MTSINNAASVRSAESNRTSSCLFADRIAQLSIATYKLVCPLDLQDSYKQTVLAAFLIQRVHSSGSDVAHADGNMEGQENDDRSLEVVSLGVGTKVLSHRKVIDEYKYSQITGVGGRLVRDCHAEVLARRGLLKYLYNELHILMDHELLNDNEEIDCEENPSSSLSSKHQPSPSSCSAFIFCKSTGQLVLRKGCTVHLYSSSQPCGNATIKKWAKGKKPQRFPLLSSIAYPDSNHTRLQVTALAEGQVSLLAKKNNNHTDLGEKKTFPIKTGAHLEQIPDLGLSLESGPDLRDDPPPGTVYLIKGTGSRLTGGSSVMCCSDKIAKWNAVGVQGGLLSVFYKPLYLTTVTVGRKFSGVHLERALCCRLQDFNFNFTLECQPSKNNKNKNKNDNNKNNVGSKNMKKAHGFCADKNVEINDGVYGMAGAEGGGGGGGVGGEVKGRIQDRGGEESAALGVGEERKININEIDDQMSRKGSKEKKVEAQIFKALEAEEKVEEKIEKEIEKEVEKEVEKDEIFGLSLYRIHHPTMLCTAVKFDNSAIITEISPEIEGKKEIKNVPILMITKEEIEKEPELPFHDAMSSVLIKTKENKELKDGLAVPEILNEKKVVFQIENEELGARFHEKKCFCWWKVPSIENEGKEKRGGKEKGGNREKETPKIGIIKEIEVRGMTRSEREGVEGVRTLGQSRDRDSRSTMGSCVVVDSYTGRGLSSYQRRDVGDRVKNGVGGGNAGEGIGGGKVECGVGGDSGGYTGNTGDRARSSVDEMNEGDTGHAEDGVMDALSDGERHRGGDQGRDGNHGLDECSGNYTEHHTKYYSKDRNINADAIDGQETKEEEKKEERKEEEKKEERKEEEKKEERKEEEKKEERKEEEKKEERKEEEKKEERKEEEKKEERKEEEKKEERKEEEKKEERKEEEKKEERKEEEKKEERKEEEKKEERKEEEKKEERKEEEKKEERKEEEKKEERKEEEKKEERKEEEKKEERKEEEKKEERKEEEKKEERKEEEKKEERKEEDDDDEEGDKNESRGCISAKEEGANSSDVCAISSCALFADFRNILQRILSSTGENRNTLFSHRILIDGIELEDGGEHDTKNRNSGESSAKDVHRVNAINRGDGRDYTGNTGYTGYTGRCVDVGVDLGKGMSCLSYTNCKRNITITKINGNNSKLNYCAEKTSNGNHKEATNKNFSVFLNPYANAKNVLFTDFRFFSDWVRKADFP